MGGFSKNILRSVPIFAIGLFAISGNAFAQVTTLPSVTTYDATDISQGFAVLQGYMNPNGSTDTARWFEWGASQTSLIYQTTQATQYIASNISEGVSGLSPGTAYYFRAAARNSAGVAYGNVYSFTAANAYAPPPNYAPNYGQPPAVITYAPTGVGQNSATFQGYTDPRGDYNTTRWFEYYAGSGGTYRTLTAPQGLSASNFSEYIGTLLPNMAYYYRAVAQNSAGTSYGTYYALTTGNGGGGSATPIVVTNMATNTAGTSALLNGTALPGGATLTSAWFEWGTSIFPGNQTTARSIGSGASIPFSDSITGLAPGTLYYYRAVAQNQYGTVRGNALSFRTIGAATAPPAPTSVAAPAKPAVKKAEDTSPLVLSITSDRERVRPGEEIFYAVSYKNERASEMKNLKLRVVLPESVFYKSGGDFSIKDNVLELDLPNLSAKESSNKSFRATVGRDFEKEGSITTTATMSYADVSGKAQKDVEAGVTNIVDQNLAPLSASLLGSLSQDLLLWFLIVFDLAAVIFIVYLLRKKAAVAATT